MRRDTLSMSAGKGFGQGQNGDANFPSIDAFAKDPNILIKDRNEMAKMPSEPAIDQFSKDRSGNLTSMTSNSPRGSRSR